MVVGSSQAPLRIPKIDFSPENLQPGSDDRRLTGAQVLDALQTYGCFEADFPQIPKEARAAIFPALKELFALPVGTKSGNKLPMSFHGYVGHRPGKPLVEIMGIEGADVEGNVESFTRLMWPHGNPNFSDTIVSFAKTVAEVECLVIRLVLECLGVEKYCDSYLEKNSYLLRMLKYDVPPTDDPKFGLHAHTDAGTLTLLYPDQDALEIQTKNGEWVQTTASPNSFIMMAGDSFQVWTNGRVHAPMHRIMMTGDKERYSIVVFVIPQGIIQALPELIDEEHPLLYKPYDHQAFLKYLYTEEGQRAKSAIKTYCGIFD